jgi:light-regulated signal transduction histidine kinase (bacteriophytochrome)
LARLDEGRVLMQQIDSNMDKMRHNELLLLKERRKAKRDYELLLPGNVRISFILTGLLTLVFGLWIFIELKKRFRFQALLQHKLMELRQNNEELEQIAFAASHDLQEPLRKIRIFSDRLLLKTKHGKDEENYQMTERINVAATRLQNLIGDLVTFNNLVQNKFEINSVSLRDIICQCIGMAKQKLPEMHVTVNEDDLPAIIGAEEQVLILFQQLFNNAIEFRSPDRTLEIQIETSKLKWSQIRGLPGEITVGDFYYLKIKDNGIGFDEAYKSKMFKPFQRLHNYETETNARRKGMGLAMCKRVMLNVGGWIDATGQVGKGAVIHLYFPFT